MRRWWLRGVLVSLSVAAAARADEVEWRAVGGAKPKPAPLPELIRVAAQPPERPAGSPMPVVPSAPLVPGTPPAETLPLPAPTSSDVPIMGFPDDAPPPPPFAAP